MTLFISRSLNPAQPVFDPILRAARLEALDATFVIYLPRAVNGFVSLPDQLLSVPPDLIQFFVISFVKNIFDSLFQIFLRHRNVVPILCESQGPQWAAHPI